MRYNIWLSTIVMGMLLLFSSCSDFEEGDYPAPTELAPGAMPGSDPVTAVAHIAPLTDRDISGTVTFTKGDSLVSINGTIEGLKAGKHGFHIHAGTSCDEPGGHLSPADHAHGAPTEAEHHLGDLGNLVADSSGIAHYETISADILLEGENSIVGHALIIHEGTDAFLPQPSGDAGSKVACGIVTIEQAG